MAARPARAAQRQTEHLVEVAVVHVALPVDADQVAAHHRVEVLVAVRLLEQLQVAVQAALGHQRGPETLDRHVRQRVEPGEAHAPALAEHPAVVVLQARLRGRQHRALGVVDQVEREPAFGVAVAQRGEPSQGRDARLEDALAALAVDVVLEIAGQRRGDLDALPGEKRRGVFLTRLEQHGEVAAVDHPDAGAPRALDHRTEVRVELGRAPGEVQRRSAAHLEISEHEVDGLPVHRFGAMRPRVDVTVHAGLVAAVAQIDLQRRQGAPADRREVGSRNERQDVVHGL